MLRSVRTSYCLVSLVSLVGCASSTRTAVEKPVVVQGSISELLDKASLSLRDGRYEEASRTYDAILRKPASQLDEKTKSKALYNKAYALHRLRRWTNAIDAYLQVLVVQPDAVDAALNLSSIHLEHGDTKATTNIINILRDVLKQVPRDAKLLNQLGLLYQRNGQQRKAVLMYRRVLSNYRDYLPVYIHLAQVYLEMSRADAAELVLQDGLAVAEEAEADAADFYYGLAMVAVAKNDGPLAFEHLRKGVQLAPRSADIQFGLAKLALQYHDYASAVRSFTAVDELKPNSVEVLVGLGEALQGQKKWVASAQNFERVRALYKRAGESKKEKLIVRRLMLLYSSAQQFDKALGYGAEYMKLDSISCDSDSIEGFCGQYNGIKLMSQMDG